MKDTIGLLTNNNEIHENLRVAYPETDFIIYRSVDSVKKDESMILLIDSEFFDSPDSVQFYLSKIRKKLMDTPVILIHRVGQIDEIETDWFFNDFILYPFRRGELSVRIKRLLTSSRSDEDKIMIGPFRIDINEYSVYMNNEKLDLTYKEFELLRLLAQNRGTVFSRKDLLNIIWGVEYIGGTRTVDVHIRRLRGKLGSEFNSIIETVRNVGYRCRE